MSQKLFIVFISTELELEVGTRVGIFIWVRALLHSKSCNTSTSSNPEFTIHSILHYICMHRCNM